MMDILIAGQGGQVNAIGIKNLKIKKWSNYDIGRDNGL
jgi:hypothetical protein